MITVKRMDPKGRAAALVRRVREVCPLSASAARILEATAREDIDLRTVTRIVECDPALAAQVLRLANSCSYAMRERVSDLRIGIRTIGFDAVRTLAGAMALLAAFRSAAADAIDIHAISTVAAGIAGTLAARLTPRLESAAFASGLLCEIGALASLTVDADEYASLWKTTIAEEPSWSEGARRMRLTLETERYGATTEELGAILLARNSLPEQIVRAVETREPCKPDVAALGRIVAFARLAAAALLQTPEEAALADAITKIAARCSLDEIAIDEIQDICRDAIAVRLDARRTACG
jgi:HD-like signal output (HDOD) protein